jgi:hypothetical protein
MKPASDQYSPNSHSNNYDFKLTIIDSRTLPLRLATELSMLTDEVRCAWPELRRDPVGVGRRLLSRSLKTIQLWSSQPGYVLGLVSAVLVVGSLTGLIIALERSKVTEITLRDLEDFTPADAVMVDLTTTQGTTTGGYDRTALGRVGLRHDKGEG